MTALTDRMTESGFALLTDQVGESATYARYSGPEQTIVAGYPITVTAIVPAANEAQDFVEDGEGKTYTATTTILVSDVAAPQIDNDTITFSDGDVWTVKGIPSIGNGVATLQIERWESIRKGKQELYTDRG